MNPTNSSSQPTNETITTKSADSRGVEPAIPTKDNNTRGLPPPAITTKDNGTLGVSVDPPTGG